VHPNPNLNPNEKAAETNVDISKLAELKDNTAPNLAPDAAPTKDEDLTHLRKRLALDDAKLSALEARFKAVLDKDGDGGMDLPEFLSAMPELGQQSPALAKSLFKAFDHDNSGKISASELLAGLASLCEGSSEEKSAFVFSLYDSDKDGFVTKEELTLLLKSYFGGKAAISAQTVECYDLEDVDFDAEESANAGERLAADSADKYDVIAQLDSSVNDFVTQIFEADANQDGKLSQEEFKNWLQKEAKAPSVAGTEAVKWAELLAGKIMLA